MEYNPGIIEDEGLARRLQGHQDELPQEHVIETEPVNSIAVNVLELYEQASTAFNRHRKRYIALGVTAVAGLGFATGAVTISHRHAH